MRIAKPANEDSPFEKESRGCKMFRPKLNKLECERDLLQTSSHVLLFIQTFRPSGFFRPCIVVKASCFFGILINFVRSLFQTS